MDMHIWLLYINSLHFIQGPPQYWRGYRNVKSGPENNMNPLYPWTLWVLYSEDMATDNDRNVNIPGTALAVLERENGSLPGQLRSISPNSYYKYVPSTNSIVMSHSVDLLLAVCFILVSWVIFRSWRWRRYVPLKRLYTFISIHGTVSQASLLRTSNPAY
jgi:hypothetical protein